ncbi:DUF4905 domain-containing protein [Marinoscillum sp.]|uniref:DUF4905 domain-containing protein n=1 Tax=Marinoscillum sp. TaxID=2024838 RepID=UPI003BAD39DD
MKAATFRFSLELTDKIWQVVLSEETGKLIAEVRNEETQSTKYHLIDLVGCDQEESFTIQQSDLWTSILHYCDPYLLLEQFKDPNDPSTKDLMIYDVLNKTVEAEISQFQFQERSGLELIGVDPKDPKIEKAYTLRTLNTSNTYHMRSPVYYPSGSESCQLVEEFLDIPASGLGCEYLEEGDFIIICYYVRLGTKFDRWLMVIKSECEIYHSRIDREMDGFASGGFFVLDRLLVFIENRIKIHGVEL